MSTSSTKTQALTNLRWFAYHPMLISAALASLVVNLVALAPSLYMLQVFDRVMLSANFYTLLISTCFLFVVLGAMGVGEALRARLLVRFGTAIDELYAPRLFSAVLARETKDATSDPSLFIREYNSWRTFITSNGAIVCFDAPWMVIYLGVLFLLHPLLGYAGCVFGLIQLSLTGWGISVLRRRNERINENRVVTEGRERMFLAAKEDVLVHGLTDAVMKRWRHASETEGEDSVRYDRFGLGLSAFSKALRYTQQSAGLAIGGWLAIRGEITAGAMIVGSLLMTRALQPIDMLLNSWKAFGQALVSFRRVSEVIGSGESSDVSLEVPSPRDGAVDVNKLVVCLAGRRVIDGVSFRVASGSVSLISGPSGSGKSTLLKTMLFPRDVESGSITIGGVPAQRIDSAGRAACFGYLPQEVRLLSGSVADNIAGFTEVDSQAIVEATKLAGVHELILRLPQGYETPVGVAGQLLSSGQRQRIALARAIYKWPKFVFLDEPDANLDDIGSAALAACLDSLKMRGVTTFIVSHRFKDFDKIDHHFELSEGNVRETLPIKSTTI